MTIESVEKAIDLTLAFFYLITLIFWVIILLILNIVERWYPTLTDAIFVMETKKKLTNKRKNRIMLN